VHEIEIRRLTYETLPEINCCPDGVEVKGSSLRGDLSQTLTWRKKMLDRGMTGFVAYYEGQARGFIEYMPADVAPIPIDALGGAVLMCYHWAPVDAADEGEHHREEVRLIQRVIEETRHRFSGLATMGWANPVHFPISLLEGVGFRPIQQSGGIRLMWLGFRAGAVAAQMRPESYEPRDLSSEGLLAIDAAWSSRCPYSIHNAARLSTVIDDLPAGVMQTVRFNAHCLDTREATTAYCFSPWNWEWTYFNGEEIPVSEMPSKQIKQRILTTVSDLAGQH